MTDPSQPLTVYGRQDCDDTERTRDWLRARRVSFSEIDIDRDPGADAFVPVSYTHLRAHETVLDLVCRLLLEKKK